MAVSPTTQEAAQILMQRRLARRDLGAWNQVVGNIAALHHRFINEKLQQITDSPTSRYVIILMPPGAAKSTYASVAFPPWYLARRVGCSILACSYSYTLAETFGKRARNLADLHSEQLGYSLKGDSKAAGEWEVTSGGRYFCAGVGAGIAGHRADLGLIDDYLGNQEDADSKLVRDKQWAWFSQDFFPRLKPNASVVIIANRRHQDDLVGRLLDAKRDDKSPIPPEQWEVIKLPFFAKENDPLGRAPGERIWPEWFTPEQASQVNRLPARMRSGLYQQDPAPDDGDFFKKEYLIGYKESELPALSDLIIYAASDHAISKRDDANKTAMGVFGFDKHGVLWWLPEGLVWKRLDAKEQAYAMLRLNKQFNVLSWFAEKGHITMSIGPFLRDLMNEQRNFINITEYVPKKDKPTRARSIQGLAATGRFRVPKFAPWWPDVEAQLLAFPGSSEDDVVDMLAHMGRAIESMSRPSVALSDEQVEAGEQAALVTLPTRGLTYKNLFTDQRKKERREAAMYN